jgi:hypothetical protein
MAKLKLRIPTLDAVPKEQQALYRAMDGGGFILDTEADPDGWGIDNLALIRGKLDERGRDYERANAKLQGFKKADGSLYTVEELQALATANNELSRTVETLKDKSKTSDDKLQQMVADATRPLHEQITKHKAAVERYRATSHKAYRTEVVNKALGVLKPQDRWRNLIARELEAQIDVREAEDGTLSHVVLHPETGRPRMSSLQGRDGPMDITEWAGGAELKKAFGDCLQGDNRKGADINGNVQPPNGDQPQRRGGDVVLPKEYTQTQFEAAWKQAREQGGEVRFAEEGQPTT